MAIDSTPFEPNTAALGSWISTFHETTLPPGFGLRQPSGAFVVLTGSKAAEDCRTPKRSRPDTSCLGFKAPKRDSRIVETAHEPMEGNAGLIWRTAYCATRCWMNPAFRTRGGSCFRCVISQSRKLSANLPGAPASRRAVPVFGRQMAGETPVIPAIEPGSGVQCAIILFGEISHAGMAVERPAGLCAAAGVEFRGGNHRARNGISTARRAVHRSDSRAEDC